MASKGPKTGVRKPVTKVTPPAPLAVPPVAVAEEAPPVPFVSTPVEVAPVIEAVVEAAKQSGEIAAVAADAAGNTTEPAAAEPIAQTPAAAEPLAQTHAATEEAAHIIEDETMAFENEATATVENAAQKAQNLMGDFNDRAKSAMEKGARGMEEWNDMAKGNVEALVESGRIAAKGFESLGQNAAEYGRRSFESATATMKTLASAKSPTEFMKLQSDFVRQSFDAFVAEASKTTETVLKLAGDAAQPISNRMAVAADKVKVAA